MAELNHVPELRPEVAVQEVDTDVLAFDGETLTHLSGAAAEVARAVDGIRCVADLTHDLGADVGQALDLLIGHGLVDLAEPSPGPRYRRPDHVGACLDGERVVLVDLVTGDRHLLDGGGSLIWELLTSGDPLSTAIEDLEAAFPDAGVADEAGSLVEQLVGLGLLEAVATSGSPGDPGDG